MKKIFLAFALFAAAAATTNIAKAQVSVNFNIGRQPLWGPTGYDNADYYYLPDVDAYYNVMDQQFVYMDGGQWVYRNSLPYQYRNYDLYHGYKVVINDRNPWMRNDYYRRQYYGYRGRHGQSFIRDSRDNRYWANPNHPYHNRWNGVDEKAVDRGDYNRGGYNRGDRGYRGGGGDYRRDGDRRNEGGYRGGGQGNDRGNRGNDRSYRGDDHGNRGGGDRGGRGEMRQEGGDRRNGGGDMKH